MYNKRGLAQHNCSSLLPLRLLQLVRLPHFQLNVGYLLAAAGPAAAAAAGAPLQQVIYQHTAVGIAQNLRGERCGGKAA